LLSLRFAKFQKDLSLLYEIGPPKIFFSDRARAVRRRESTFAARLHPAAGGVQPAHCRAGGGGG
jgi:hypothetical protein